jgi:hypothetical protein
VLGERVDGVSTATTPAPAQAEARRRGGLRALLAVMFVVFVAGALHAGLYAVSFPPWAIEDEQQHVDYVWKLAFDHQMPDIGDPLDRSVVEAVDSTDRWGDYGLRRPPAVSPEAMGMEGYSYEAYHPPLAYLALSAVALPVGERPLALMYALRAVDALVAGAVAALTALLAWTWTATRWTTPRPGPDAGEEAGRVGGTGLAGPDGPRHAGRTGLVERARRWPLVSLVSLVDDERRRVVVAGAAGVGAAALPALADSGGRVDIDGIAALLVVGGTLLVGRWLESPSAGRAWAVGAVLAAAVLTRETALVLVVPVAAAAVVAGRRGTLRPGRDGTRALAPPALAFAAWTAFYRWSTGYLDPSEHIRDRHGAHHPFPGTVDFLRAVGDRALVPYGRWPMPGWLTLLVVAVVVAGVVLALRRGPSVAAVVAAVTLGLQLALVFQQAREGSSAMSARLLLPAYPLVLAAACAGLGTLRSRAAPLLVPAAVAALAVVFLAGSFVPRFPPGLG